MLTFTTKSCYFLKHFIIQNQYYLVLLIKKYTIIKKIIFLNYYLIKLCNIL